MNESGSLASDRLSTASSRLGRALLQLNAALCRVEEREARIDQILGAWDRSWESRRSEILHWLSASDAEAAAPPAPVRTERPSLSLMTLPQDAEEMLSMIEN